VLTQKLLLVIRHISGNMYHKDVVPAGRAGKVIELLRKETGSFILPDQ